MRGRMIQRKKETVRREAKILKKGIYRHDEWGRAENKYQV
jgi:hypothetical protein